MPAGVRTFTAPSSSRSRDSVACVTSTPETARRRPSSVWLENGLASSSSTMRAWRAAFVNGTARTWARRGEAMCSALFQQPGQQRLLRMQPVFGLVPDGGLRAVDDGSRDLLAAVSRQAVQDDGIRRGGGE